jgi:hypothetical protein
MAMQDAVLARLLIDDDTKIGFMSFQRNAERARKTSQAFRDQGINNIVEGLDKQVRALKLSAKELSIFEAATYGATQAQKDQISKIYDDIDALKAQKAQQEQAVREQQEAQQAADNLAASIERKITALRTEAATLDMTEDEIEQYKLQQMGATQAQIDAVMAQRRHLAGLKQQQKETEKANRGLRMMRGGFGQVGHQIQDVAVQLQMGQNALLVFGQQGSQIVSLFGSGGAMVGAILAVGAAVGTYLAPKLFSTKNNLQLVEEAAEEAAKMLKIDFVTGVALVTDELDRLSRRSENLARSTLQLKLVNAMTAAEDAATGLKQEMDALIPATLDTNINQTISEFTLLSRELGLNETQLQSVIDEVNSFRFGQGATIESVAALTQSIVDQNMATIHKSKAFVEANNRIQEYKVAQEDQKVIIDAITRLLNGENFELERNANKTDQAKKKLEEQIKSRKDFLNSLQEELWAIGKTNVELAVRNALLLGMSEEEVNLVRIKAEQIRITNAYNALVEEETAATEAAKKSKEDFVAGVIAQSNELGKSNIELLIAKANTMGLSEEQNQAFINAINNIKKFQDAQDKAANRDKAIDQLTPILESLMTEEELIKESYTRRNQIITNAYDQQIISFEHFNELMLKMERKQQEELDSLNNKELLRGSKLTGHMLGQLGEQFSGVQAHNRKMFAVQKAYKIASAIQNTYTAANEALASPYPWPLPQVFAATAVAAGLANVAAIKASSFDGGGFTGMGSRSGGVDGKGGFPAILHPNETVVDHTKGQSQGITIVTNVDARGSGPDVDMKIRKAVEMGNQQTVSVIRDLAARGRLV